MKILLNYANQNKPLLNLPDNIKDLKRIILEKFKNVLGEDFRLEYTDVNEDIEDLNEDVDLLELHKRIEDPRNQDWTKLIIQIRQIDDFEYSKIIASSAYENQNSKSSSPILKGIDNDKVDMKNHNFDQGILKTQSEYERVRYLSELEIIQSMIFEDKPNDFEEINLDSKERQNKLNEEANLKQTSTNIKYEDSDVPTKQNFLFEFYNEFTPTLDSDKNGGEVKSEYNSIPNQESDSQENSKVFEFKSEVSNELLQDIDQMQFNVPFPIDEPKDISIVIQDKLNDLHSSICEYQSKSKNLINDQLIQEKFDSLLKLIDRPPIISQNQNLKKEDILNSNIFDREEAINLIISKNQSYLEKKLDELCKESLGKCLSNPASIYPNHLKSFDGDIISKIDKQFENDRSEFDESIYTNDLVFGFKGGEEIVCLNCNQNLSSLNYFKCPRCLFYLCVKCEDESDHPHNMIKIKYRASNMQSQLDKNEFSKNNIDPSNLKKEDETIIIEHKKSIHQIPSSGKELIQFYEGSILEENIISNPNIPIQDSKEFKIEEVKEVEVEQNQNANHEPKPLKIEETYKFHYVYELDDDDLYANQKFPILFTLYITNLNDFDWENITIVNKSNHTKVFLIDNLKPREEKVCNFVLDPIDQEGNHMIEFQLTNENGDLNMVRKLSISLKIEAARAHLENFFEEEEEKENLIQPQLQEPIDKEIPTSIFSKASFLSEMFQKDIGKCVEFVMSNSTLQENELIDLFLAICIQEED